MMENGDETEGETLMVGTMRGFGGAGAAAAAAAAPRFFL